MENRGAINRGKREREIKRERERCAKQNVMLMSSTMGRDSVFAERLIINSSSAFMLVAINRHLDLVF